MKKLKEREKRYGKASKHISYPENENAVNEQSYLAQSDENHYQHVKPTPQQPPVSQSMSGPLKPKTFNEAKIATLLARSNLLITRDIEWANQVLGFEQENRYAVVDVCYPQAVSDIPTNIFRAFVNKSLSVEGTTNTRDLEFISNFPYFKPFFLSFSTSCGVYPGAKPCNRAAGYILTLNL